MSAEPGASPGPHGASPGAAKRAGSYLVQRQMKESYLQVLPKSSSPLKQVSRQGSPTRAEATALKQEVAKLQQLNAELVSKLAFAESKIPGLAKALGLDILAGDGSVHISAIKRSPAPAKGPKPDQTGTGAQAQPPGSGPSTPRHGSAAAAGLAVVPGLLVDDLLLSKAEEEEAAMRCCWLAHYWVLAEQLGICPDIASEKAAHWRSLAMPLDAFFECARAAALPYMAAKVLDHYQKADPSLQRLRERAVTGSSMGAQQAPTFTLHGSGGATVVDLLEMERACRQLSELGVVPEVQAALTHLRTLSLSAQGPWAQEASSQCSGPGMSDAWQDPEDPATTGDGGVDTASTAYGLHGSGGVHHGSSAAVAAAAHSMAHLQLAARMDPEEREVAVQRAWVAYLWARAAAAGIEPHLSRQRAEHWAHQLLCPPSLQRHALHVPAPAPSAYDPYGSSAYMHQHASAGARARELCELHAAQQELVLLGIEQQLWQRRAATRAGPKQKGAAA